MGAMISGFSDFMADRRRTNPGSIMDIGDGGLNRLDEGMFLDNRRGDTLFLPSVSADAVQGNRYEESYNNRGDVTRNPTLLQKKLKLGVDNG